LNHSEDFHETQQGHAIEGDLNEIFFNPAASNIPKWQMFKLLSWTENFIQSTRND
jgi:hypothetical protein